jgi:drug/metabolite transporter (DMT)-like permease
VTAGNFLFSVPFAVALSIVSVDDAKLDSFGVWYAVASGAVASGIGYAIWYSVLPSLRAASAATIQLSVPVSAVFGGLVILGESLTVRLALASIAILGGIALVVQEKQRLAT